MITRRNIVVAVSTMVTGCLLLGMSTAIPSASAQKTFEPIAKVVIFGREPMMYDVSTIEQNNGYIKFTDMNGLKHESTTYTIHWK